MVTDMTIHEKVAAALTRCVASILWKNELFADYKGYYTRMDHFAGNQKPDNTDDQLYVFDVLKTQWVAIKWGDIIQVEWESHRMYPYDLIDNPVAETDEWIKAQDVYVDTIKSIINESLATELPDMGILSDRDLRYTYLCDTGIMLQDELSRDQLIDRITDVYALKACHKLNREEIILRIIGHDYFNYLSSIMPNASGAYVQIGRGDLRTYLSQFKEKEDIQKAYDVWVDIIEWHIDKNVSELTVELSEASDPDDKDEIETAIALVKDALNDASIDQFESVSDVCHFWPPILYPPPQFVL